MGKAFDKIMEALDDLKEGRFTVRTITPPKPIRLQLSRRKGFDLQALSIAANGLHAVNVARPSKWGNPFTVKDCREAGFKGDDTALALRCVEAFRVWADTVYWQTNWQGPASEARREAILRSLPSIRGKNLACWCKAGDPCHSDVLLEMANRPICEEVA